MATSAKGKVKRIYIDKTRCYITLEYNPDHAQTPHPLNDYFHLLLNHPNYNALYSLALSAAINGYELWIRATNDIVSNQPAEVEYMVVDW